MILDSNDPVRIQAFLSANIIEVRSFFGSRSWAMLELISYPRYNAYNMKKLILFDFDGTIADSMPAILKIIKEAAFKNQLVINPEQIMAQARAEGLRAVFHEFKVPWYRLPQLVRFFRGEYKLEVPNLKLVKGIDEVLKKFKAEDCKLALISTNSLENITVFLKLNGLEELFDFIMPSIGLFSKAGKIKKVLKKFQFADLVFFIGDEDRDIEAGKKAGTKTVAVTWGMQSKEMLAKSNPDYLIDNPSKLLELIENL